MSSEESGIFNYEEQGKTARSSRVPHALIITAAMVIILAGIQAASGLVGPMLLALFLAVILLVPLRWLQNHGCPQFLAFLIVLVCTIALFVGIIYIVSQSLTDQISKMPFYRDQLVEKYAELENQLEKWGFMIGEFIPKRGEVEPDEPTPDEPAVPVPMPEETAPPDAPIVPVPPPDETPPVIIKKIIRPTEDTSTPPDSDPISEAVDQEDAESSELEPDETQISIAAIHTLSPEEMEEFVRQAIETIDPPSLIALDPQIVALWITRVMVYMRSMLEGGFLVLIFTIFMLFEASVFPAKVNRAFGKDGPINIEHFHRIAEDIRRYLFLKTLANLMSGGAAMFVYYMFGVPAWFFWGIVAFFMYYIPNIGGTLAAIIPGALILMGPYGIPGVLVYAVCLLTIECAIAYGIEPKILGHGLRLSTLVIILSLFFWGFLLGPIGLFLAAPLTVMIKIILQAFPETRWLAIFLDGGRKQH